MTLRTDVAIIGGGIMGSALTYWLTALEPGIDVTVVERDPTYATASSALSAASIRQQFTTPKLPIDVINGSPLLREWVDDKVATPADLDAITRPDEQSWMVERQAFLIY